MPTEEIIEETQGLGATIVVVIILLVILGLVVYKMVKNRRAGKMACGCDCGCCAMKGDCHK